MKTITLALMSPDGDQLGLLAVPAVQIAVETETGRHHTGVPVHRQMDELHSRVREALEEAGLDTPLEPLDLRILVGRAMVRQMDREDIVVPVPVLADGGNALETEPYPPNPGSAEQDVPDTPHLAFAAADDMIYPFGRSDAEGTTGGGDDSDASGWAAMFTKPDGAAAKGPEGGEP